MFMKDDLTYLHHIRDAIEAIFQYLEGVEYPQFQSEKMRVDAVVRQLMVIGEAASHIGDDFKNRHPLYQLEKNSRNAKFSGTRILWRQCQSGLGDLPQQPARTL
jgi:hypothetical protein